MSSSSTDLAQLKPSDKHNEAALPITSNGEVPTVNPTEQVHHSQRQGIQPPHVGRVRTPISESPITIGGDTVSGLVDFTQGASTVPVTASKDLDVIATAEVEHNDMTEVEKVEGQRKRQGEKKGKDTTEEMETLAGNKEGQEGGENFEQGEGKRETKAAEEEIEEVTDEESSISTIISDDLDEQPWLPRKTEDIVAEHQQRSAKYARVTGAYVEGLEARVGMLESHVRKLRTLGDLSKPLEIIK